MSPKNLAMNKKSMENKNMKKNNCNNSISSYHSWLLLLLTIITFHASAQAQDKSIYEIQYTTDANGDSPLNGQLIDCTGGIVAFKIVRSVPRLVLYDPAHPSQWGGIQVKDVYNITSKFDGIEVGDWITLQNTKVEEYRGTTFLQLYAANNPIMTVTSSGNTVPAPLTLDPNDIAAPLPGAYEDYYVADHSAEKYESMFIRVEDVTVTEMYLGKANDNYELTSNTNSHQCWAADYYNQDRDPYEPYCDDVQTDQKFCFLEGVLEQYTSIYNGFDYYQLMTLNADHLNTPPDADLNDDCKVDMIDFAIFSNYWLNTNCNSFPNCQKVDCNSDNNLNLTDLTCFANQWLDGVND
jgi:Dockerin type I domain